MTACSLLHLIEYCIYNHTGPGDVTISNIAVKYSEESLALWGHFKNCEISIGSKSVVFVVGSDSIVTLK